MKTNYVLIDFENVQPATLKMLNQEHFKVIIFVGAKQKLAIDLAASIHQIGERAEYVKIGGEGPNALDFHIAFYIGQLAVQEPGACFHIISKDTGFDPLIKHLAGKHITVRRLTDTHALSDGQPAKAGVAHPAPELSIASTKPARQDADRMARIVASLKKQGNARPGKVETLAKAINTLFSNTLSEGELEAIIQELRQRHYVSVDSDQKVSYKLPA